MQNQAYYFLIFPLYLIDKQIIIFCFPNKQIVIRLFFQWREFKIQHYHHHDDHQKTAPKSYGAVFQLQVQDGYYSTTIRCVFTSSPLMSRKTYTPWAIPLVEMLRATSALTMICPVISTICSVASALASETMMLPLLMKAKGAPSSPSASPLTENTRRKRVNPCLSEWQ